MKCCLELGHKLLSIVYIFLVGKESSCKNIKVEDADGYEIPSDKEFQRYMRNKEQPELRNFRDTR